MIEENAIRQTAERINALDLSAENAAVAALEAERARVAIAIERARNRVEEIGRTIREQRQPEGAEVAAALLADEAVPVENIRALEEERAALNAGHRDLNQRTSDIWQETKTARNGACSKAAQAVAPLAAAILAEAQEAGETIRRAHGAMRALTLATGSTPEGAQAVAAAYEAMTGPHERLIAPAGEVRIDAELSKVLNLLGGKGEALRALKIGSVIPI